MTSPLPPETISAQLYTGPGSFPLMTTAAAWDTTSTALCSTATAHGLVTTSIPWTGPSATAMRAASARYTTWLTATAEHAAHTAALARAAASAYETARATAVHPAAIAANRTQLATLTATNILGVNTAAIAATEAQYAAMWAQDIAAMATYKATAASITAQLPTWTPPAPPPIVSYLLGYQTIPQLFWSTFQANLSSGPWQGVFQLLSLFTVLWAAASPDSPFNPTFRVPPAQDIIVAPPPQPAPVPAGEPPTARMGVGNRLGPLLRVPPSWAVPRQIPTLARPIQVGSSNAVIQPFPLPFPLAVGAGSAQSGRRRPDPEYGETPTVMPKHPYGG